MATTNKEQKTDTYNATAKQIAEYKKFMDSHLQEGIKQLKAKHPSFNEGFLLRTQVEVHKKKPPQYYRRVMDHIMTHLLREDGPKKTQKSIVADVSKELPEYEKIPETVFQKLLQPWEKKRIKQLIDDKMKKPISIRGCQSLSQVKEKLFIAKEEEQGAKTIKATVRVGKDMLSVDNTVYSISIRKAGGREYPSIRVSVGSKRISLRVDAVIALLEGASE